MTPPHTPSAPPRRLVVLDEDEDGETLIKRHTVPDEEEVRNLPISAERVDIVPEVDIGQDEDNLSISFQDYISVASSLSELSQTESQHSHERCGPDGVSSVSVQVSLASDSDDSDRDLPTAVDQSIQVSLSEESVSLTGLLSSDSDDSDRDDPNQVSLAEASDSLMGCVRNLSALFNISLSSSNTSTRNTSTPSPSPPLPRRSTRERRPRKPTDYEDL